MAKAKVKSGPVFYATGRRKAAIARVWLYKGQKGFFVNGQASDKYLKRSSLQMMVEAPLIQSNALEEFRIKCKVHGGGIAGQAGAIRLGISRALLQHDEKLRPALRRQKYLTRDPREKERKKFGRKGARRSFQFTKR